MNNFEEKLRKLQSVHLDENSKARIKADLVLLTQDKSKASFLVRWQSFAALTMALLLITGGGALASQGALPGDLLYPIKVNVNEEIAGAFAGSDEKGLEFELDLIDKRTEELEQLVEEGRFDDRRSAIIEAQFEKRFEKIKERMAELIEKGKVESALRLSDSLEARLSQSSFLEERVEADSALFEMKMADDEAIEESSPAGEAQSSDLETFRAVEMTQEIREEVDGQERGNSEEAKQRIEDIQERVRFRLERERQRRAERPLLELERGGQSSIKVELELLR